MKPKLRKLIAAFEAAQARYAAFGAMDTEPDSVFQSLIRKAAMAEPIDWDSVDWQLYSERDSVAVAATLSRLAGDVCKYIGESAGADDIRSLRDYCWRVDW